MSCHSDTNRGKRRERPSEASGFTLIELLVVVSIIALLAAILFPVFGRVRENARRASCQSNEKQIWLGFTQYTQDYDARYPSIYASYTSPAAPTWRNLIFPYLKNVQMFRCPSGRTLYSSGETTPDGQIIPASYTGNGGAANYSLGGTCVLSTSDGAYGPVHSEMQIPLPAETIVIGEGNGASQYYWNCGTACFNNAGSPANNYMWSAHFQMANYIFLDGHVKAYLPMQTIASRNMWTIEDDGPPANTTDLYKDLQVAEIYFDNGGH